MTLYDIRAKLKEQDNSSLMKARQKVEALAAKQQAYAEIEKEREKEKQKAEADARRQFQYTYPKK